MKCVRCNNEVEELFYKGSKGYYCRKCIKFKRRLLEDDIDQLDITINEASEEVFLNYSLSPQQQKISDQLAKLAINEDVILYCVCGAGKTEISLKTISCYLKQKKTVCYAISRRQVVVEIGIRLQEIFKKAKVVYVCGGHTSEVVGDIVVCTCHQLYRYEKTFDLIVLDECDAFPFKGNEVLGAIVNNACRGHIVYSSATIDNFLEEKIASGVKVLRLTKRYHNYPLPVPKQIYGIKIYLYCYLYYFLKRTSRQTIIFLPTIKLCNNFYRLFSNFFYCYQVTSKTENKDQIISDFKDKKADVIFATTILERGVTFKAIDVCIIYPEHYVFDKASLIQMSGRVGRKIDAPYGEVLFLQNQYSKNCQDCILELEACNE